MTIPVTSKGHALYLAKWMAQHLVKERTGPLHVSLAPMPASPDALTYEIDPTAGSQANDGRTD